MTPGADRAAIVTQDEEIMKHEKYEHYADLAKSSISPEQFYAECPNSTLMFI